MTPITRKILFTVLIIAVFGFGFYMYLRADNDEYVPLFMGLVFAVIPAVVINNIWNRKLKEKN